MPLSKEAMREYQRQRRGKAQETTTISEEKALEVIPIPVIKGMYHEHYWLRRHNEDAATCIAYNWRGRMIGGCGEVRPYLGKLLPSFDE